MYWSRTWTTLGGRGEGDMVKGREEHTYRNDS